MEEKQTHEIEAETQTEVLNRIADLLEEILDVQRDQLIRLRNIDPYCPS